MIAGYPDNLCGLDKVVFQVLVPRHFVENCRDITNKFTGQFHIVG
jgi:hypothetical protein